MKESRVFTTYAGDEVELTEGEMKIIRALRRLGKLWEKHGENLLLFNGDSLRIEREELPYDRDFLCAEIEHFPRIKGGGGDGGEEARDNPFLK